MSALEWSWIGACVTGTSHFASGKPCEDSAVCIEVADARSNILVMVVSDGAGSARFAKLGSSIVVRQFASSAKQFLKAGGLLKDLDSQRVSGWLDEIRDRITTCSAKYLATPREFAATLVAILVDCRRAVICHIGDGACALRSGNEEQWIVPSWPEHGEYASSTYFVTDDPEPRLRVRSVEGSFDQIVVFSDGMERLALDFAQQNGSARFFTPIASKVPDDVPGRHRGLSAGLRAFLDSDAVTTRTDDDKTLIAARRLRAP